MSNSDPIHRDPSKHGSRNWWQAEKGDVSRVALAYVQEVDRLQFDTFNRFVRLEAMYDTSPRTNPHNASGTSARAIGVMTENVVASNIDTIVAQIAATDVRAEFETDDADWEHQRTAKYMAFYADGLAKLHGLPAKCRAAFKGAALKGTSAIKVYIDQFDEIRVDRVLIDNIVVDEIECRNGFPRQMHYRDFFDAEELKAQYPEYEEEIEKARGQNFAQTTSTSRMWAGYRPFKENEVVAIESWRLPIGPRGHENYVPGRHCITISGCDLLDEEWHKPFFPFAFEKWQIPERGWYGISLAERIAGIQNALNKRNWQIERSLDKAASPITYVHQADAKLAVATVNQIGQICVYRAQKPITEVAPILNSEVYQSRIELKAAAAQESGTDQASQGGGVPAGIESGVGVREIRTTRTQRYAPQEKGFEQIWLDSLLLILDCCKDLGAEGKAPEILKRTKWGSEKIPWAKVDMKDLEIQIYAASTLNQTPAGRRQTVVEWAQAGIISQDEARRLMDHPDLERAMSIYTEALDDIEHTIWLIEGGAQLMPEPYQNLKIGIWRMQQEYLLIKNTPKVPETVLEALRAWIVTAANTLNPPAPANANMPGAAIGAPGAAPAPSSGPAAMPAVGGPAQGAFAPGTYAPMTA